MDDHRDREALLSRGWCRFPFDPELAAWVAAVLPRARAIAADPANRTAWLRSGGSWFAGVNVLTNAADGSMPAIDGLPAIPPLTGQAMRFLREMMGFGDLPLDTGQLSICYPGYPAAPQPEESEAAFRYRRDRDAAHLDGLERDAARNRRLSEAHAFILGIPISDPPPEAAPFTIWEGSHEILRRAFHQRLHALPAQAWCTEDITATYVAARRQIFAECKRVTLPARAGEAYVAHRLSLHGMAPWPPETHQRGVEGQAEDWRPIVYFRPELPKLSDGTTDFERWLNEP
ncbi:MAG: hypothetical protein AAF416_10610 [Pseudomonadota bacterium]